MASAPAAVPAPNPAPAPTLTFQPAFKRVAQSCDFDDAFACIATIAGITIEEVRTTAIKHFKHPEHGAYWIDEKLINLLLNHYGWTSTNWKSVVMPVSALPELAILLIDYSEATEIGRHVLFHRLPQTSGPKPTVEYVIDPAYWIPPEKQIRTELKALAPAWYIGIHSQYPNSGIPKTAQVVKK